MNDRRKFNSTILSMASLFDKELTEDLLDLYWSALNDLSDEEFSKAANTVARTCKFFPKPADFREQIVPDVDVKASLAYDTVKKAFIDVGIYKSVTFADPVITAVINSLGGWIAYCEIPDSELKWWRKDFERLYRQYADKADRLDVPTSLPGLHEKGSNGQGRDKAPVLIGGERKELTE